MRHAILTLHAKNSCAEILHASAAIHVRASKDRNAAEVAGGIGVQIVGLAEGMIAGTTGVVRSVAATGVQIVAQTVGPTVGPTVVPIAVETVAVDASSVVRAVDTVAVITVGITAEGTLHNAVLN